MKIKQKVVVAATSFALSIATVLILSGESMGSTLPVRQYSNQWNSVNNYLVKSRHEISQKLMVVQLGLFNSVLGNLGIEKDNFITCLNHQRSPLISSTDLLIRLLIIGSFSSVGVVGYSSFVERSCQIINKNLKIIYYSLFLLLPLQIIVSFIGTTSSYTSPINSAIRPNSSCISVNP